MSSVVRSFSKRFAFPLRRLLAVSSESIPRLPLYSIELNRSNQNEFILAGMDPYIRVYDRRFIDTHTSKPLKSFCPDLLVKADFLRENQRDYLLDD